MKWRLKMINSQITNENKNIIKLEYEFQQYLQHKKNKNEHDHDDTSQKKIQNDLLRIEKNVLNIMKIKNEQLSTLEIIDSININKMINNITNKLKNGLKSNKNGASNKVNKADKEKERMNTEPKNGDNNDVDEKKTDDEKMQKTNSRKWRFDYFYDYKNNGSNQIDTELKTMAKK